MNPRRTTKSNRCRHQIRHTAHPIKSPCNTNLGVAHIGTWGIAYHIEGIRDWLYRQRKEKGLALEKLCRLKLGTSKVRF
ncbi:hypothetical protein ACWA5Z_01720 [Testudinibacter sp. P80/BLE/0925]|uniref:hypothetical protein n=1 Tax=Testudinibacter sp. TW-1 TaxID=3417757 RepID=UPI003D35B089